MIKLIIYKDKITTTKWEEKEKIWAEYDISKLDGSIAKYFNRVVEIKPDVTVQDFMVHLEKHESVIDYCFSDYLNNVPFKLLLDDMNKQDVETEYGEVELCWEGEIMSNDLITVGYLKAWLKESKIKELGEDYDIPHDINFVSISVWKTCKFILNEQLILSDLGEMDELKKEIIFSGFNRRTLFEVISNFLADLTLNGTPTERDKLFEKNGDKGYDLHEVSKNKEQAEFWISFLDVELRDMYALRDLLVEKDDYEKAAIVKAEIELVEKELEELREEVKKNNYLL